MHLILQVLLCFSAFIHIISATNPSIMTFTLDAKFYGAQTQHVFKHVLIEQGQGEGNDGPSRCEPQLIHRSYPVKFTVDWKTCMQKVEKAVDLNDVKIVLVFRTYEGYTELEELVREVKFKNYRSNDLLDNLFAGGEAIIVIHNQADPVLKYKATVATRGRAGPSGSTATTNYRGNRVVLYHDYLTGSSSSSPSHHPAGDGMETYHYLPPLTPDSPYLEFAIFHNFHPYIFVSASVDVGEEAGKCRAFTHRYTRNMVMNLAECGVRNADDLLKVKFHLKFCNGFDEHLEKEADFAGKTGEELDGLMSGYHPEIQFHHNGIDIEKPIVTLPQNLAYLV